MVTYRLVNNNDAETIAALHAQSWSENYQTALSLRLGLKQPALAMESRAGLAYIYYSQMPNWVEGYKWLTIK